MIKNTIGKTTLMVVAGLVLSLILGLSAPAAGPIVMKIGNPGPADPHKHMIAAATLVFKDYVERHTQGGIKVEVYPGFQLGSMPQMVEKSKPLKVAFCFISDVYFPVPASLHVLPEVSLS